MIQAEPPKPSGKAMLRPVLSGDPPGKSGDDGIDIHQILGVLRRRINLVAGCVGLSTILAIIAVLQLTPRYTAEATVMLEERKNEVLDVQTLLSEMQGDINVIRTEVEVLKSPSIAAKVADKLNLYALPEFNPSLAKPGFFDFLTQPFHWVARSIKDLTSKSSDQPGDSALRDQDRKTAMVQAVAGHVDISNDGRSYLLRIRAQSNDRELAAKIANTYVDVYLLDQLEAKFDAVKRTSTWLNDQLATLRDKVRDSDRAVQVFKEQNNLTETKGGTVAEQQLSELNSQLILASADRAQKESSLRQLQDQLRAGNLNAPSVMGSALIQKLREQQAELTRKESELAQRYKPAHPTMVNIRAEIEDLKHKIDSEAGQTAQGLAGDVAAARAREASLRDTLAGLQRNTAEQGKVEVQLRELERESDANKALYENFLNKFKQANAESDIQQADARLVSPATPPTSPSYPNKTMTVGFTFVVSIFAGIAIAFLVERLDNGFRTAEQIERLVGLPTLGLVPAIAGEDSPQDLIVKRPTSQYSEAVRTIRTALRYSDIDHPPKIVLVTSSLPSEGKTVLAASLARSVARSGGKSLLVDCDLRRPNVARLLNVPAEPGILDMFAENSSLDKIIKVDEPSGMHFVPAKSGTPNPQDLLGSQLMRSFLEEMSSRYDLIVLDAPPVLAVSDAIILSHFADTTLFLVRWEKTTRPVMMGAVKALQASGGHVAGVVLSRVNARRHSAYGYGDAAYYYGRYSDYYATND